MGWVTTYPGHLTGSVPFRPDKSSQFIIRARSMGVVDAARVSCAHRYTADFTAPRSPAHPDHAATAALHFDGSAVRQTTAGPLPAEVKKSLPPRPISIP